MEVLAEMTSKAAWRPRRALRDDAEPIAQDKNPSEYRNFIEQLAAARRSASPKHDARRARAPPPALRA